MPACLPWPEVKVNGLITYFKDVLHFLYNYWSDNRKKLLYLLWEKSNGILKISHFFPKCQEFRDFCGFQILKFLKSWRQNVYRITTARNIFKILSVYTNSLHLRKSQWKLESWDQSHASHNLSQIGRAHWAPPPP